MRFNHVSTFLLSISFLACFVLADNGRMVRKGVITRAALEEARRLCPDLITREHKKRIQQEINDLLAPAFVVSDPNHKSYRLDYIPTDEERNAKVEQLCEGRTPHNTLSGMENKAGFESGTLTEALDEDEITVDNAQETGELNRVYNSESYLFFAFGLVCGLLAVSIYFHIRGSSLQVAAPKSLRRPEL